MTIKEFRAKYDVPYIHVHDAVKGMETRKMRRDGDYPEGEIVRKLLEWYRGKMMKHKEKFDGYKVHYNKVLTIAKEGREKG